MKLRTGLGLRRRLHLQHTDIAAARMAVERHALATAGRDRPRDAGRVLCYHSLGQPEWGVNDVSAVRFRQQIEAALAAGYSFVPASQIAHDGGTRRQLAFTFDDGARSVLTAAAPILRSYDIPFSFFVVSTWCDGTAGPGAASALGWDDVVRLVEAGAELGNHSATHPDFGRLSPAEAAAEVVLARDTIERRTGIRTSSFAIPLGQSANWTPDWSRMVRDLGYDLVYAQAEETRPPGTVARTFVTHFDSPRVFRALLRGRFDRWEEWV